MLEFEPRNRASDIFSLGCILYEMIAGIEGHSLSEVKDHWRRVGNGQSSFARNPEAALSWMWLDPRLALTRYNHLKLMYLVDYIHLMLDPDRHHRPSAQQVVDRLSDLGWLTGKGLEIECCAGQPLTERLVLDPWRLASYIYPSHNGDFTYILLDLRFDLVSSKHACYSQMEEPVSTLFDSFADIVAECETLYEHASRTGATKDFWKAHAQWEQSNGHLAKAKDEVETSVKLLSLKHAVFTLLPFDVSVPLTGADHRSRTSSLHKRGILISLLPVCLPRASSYGAFFYMLSFSISQMWHLTLRPTAPWFSGRFIDLTKST